VPLGQSCSGQANPRRPNLCSGFTTFLKKYFKIFPNLSQQTLCSLDSKLLQAAGLSSGRKSQWHRLWEYVIIDYIIFITMITELFPPASPPGVEALKPTFRKKASSCADPKEKLEVFGYEWGEKTNGEHHVFKRDHKASLRALTVASSQGLSQSLLSPNPALCNEGTVASPAAAPAPRAAASRAGKPTPAASRPPPPPQQARVFHRACARQTALRAQG